MELIKEKEKTCPSFRSVGVCVVPSFRYSSKCGFVLFYSLRDLFWAKNIKISLELARRLTLKTDVNLFPKVKRAVTQSISRTFIRWRPSCSLHVPCGDFGLVSCSVSPLRVKESSKGMKILVF